MPAFHQHHIPFNRGWRWKVSNGDDDTPLILGPDDTQTIIDFGLEESIEETDVIAGWIMFYLVTTAGDNGTDLSVDTVQEIPAPTGEEGSTRRSGPFNIGELLNAGDTSAVGGVPWVEHTVVDNTDIYAQFYNGFAGTPLEVRFPKNSEIFILNEGTGNVTVTGWRAGAQLIHKPKLFFQQMRAYNILTGNIPQDRYEMDSREEQFINALKTSTLDNLPTIDPEEE